MIDPRSTPVGRRYDEPSDADKPSHAVGFGAQPADSDLCFDDLDAVLAFAESEHLPAAAAVLGCSVATVQRRLHAIETKLAVTLFEREGRRLRLNRAGWVLADHAGRIVRARHDAIDSLLAVASDTRTPLRIGHTYSLGLTFVPAVMSQYVGDAHAGDRRARLLSMRQGATTTLCQLLVSGELDGAYLSASPIDADIEVVPLFTERALLCIPAERPAPETPVTLRDYRHERFIAMHHGASSRGMLTRACAQAGFVPEIVIEVDDLFGIAGAVAAGMGVAIVPARLTDYRTTGINMLAIDEHVPTQRTIYFAYRRYGPNSAELDRLQQLSRRQAAHL